MIEPFSGFTPHPRDVGVLYLACPYTHADPGVEHARVDLCDRVAAELSIRGIVTFSPLSHSVRIHEASGGSVPYAFWIRHGLAMLEKCGGMAVLDIPGARESKGVAEERSYAVASGIPVWDVPVLGWDGYLTGGVDDRVNIAARAVAEWLALFWDGAAS